MGKGTALSQAAIFMSGLFRLKPLPGAGVMPIWDLSVLRYFLEKGLFRTFTASTFQFPYTEDLGLNLISHR